MRLQSAKRQNDKMEFDSIVDLRQLRAFSCWVYFDEFTNNARIFDFGNGAGKDNVFLGIQGRGNSASSDFQFGRVGSRPSNKNLVCRAKAPREVSPQAYQETTEANIEFWNCPGPEPIDTIFPEDETHGPDLPPTANLIFEIWDTQQRKMRLLALDAIPYRKWTHVALTTTDMESFRPTWQIYINGKKIFEEPDGHMPLTSYTTNNYIGRSNWESDSSQYNDRDERFRGAMFDFRMYRQPMSASKIKKTFEWGLQKISRD